MALAIFLLLFLFLAGFFNIYFNFLPSKKLYAWLQSFFFISNKNTNPSSVSKLKKKGVYYHHDNNKNKDELKSVFATFDKNGDGFISKQELTESLRNIRMFMTEKEVEDMVVKVDSNGDGLIDFEEFCLLCESMGKGSVGGDVVEEEGEEDLRDAFNVFDRDQDGLISVEELGLVMSSLGLKEGKRVDACKEMIRKVDSDGDGRVNFDEFKNMMASGSINKLIPVR